jgi:hypothetical protein
MRAAGLTHGGFSGLLLDHISMGAPLVGGAVLLGLASLIVGEGHRLKPSGATTGEIRSKQSYAVH